jgi:hypothetical protein
VHAHVAETERAAELTPRVARRAAVRKLPGLVGGSAPTGCVTDNTGFSARGMRRTGGAAVQYLYFPEKVNDCGDDCPYLSGQSAVVFTPGVWHVVEHHLVMNTPGQRDGILEAWFDAELVLHNSEFLYRLSDPWTSCFSST